jgi:chromosomal replication initiator protein
MTQPANAATIWEAALGQLQVVVRPANFETWLRDTVGIAYADGVFTIGTPNAFVLEWLSTRMDTQIRKALASVIGAPVTLAFEVAGGPTQADVPELLAPLAAAADEVPAYLRKNPGPPPGLNPAMTFEWFVQGDENRLACQAAHAAAEGTGAINPLVIFGESGLGKTHLMHAIGHAAFARGRNAVYATAERFGNDYVKGLASELDSFRRRYRGADVLLLDDVQFLQGKEKFQDELVHAFDELHAAGKQIVVTSERVPSQLSGLSNALRSRLSWGLTADLQKPGFETRLAILRSKMRRHAAALPDDALELIAERCCPTVRELEGYLNRVLAYLPMVGGAPTAENIMHALSVFAVGEPDDAPPPAETVVAAVSVRTGVDAAALRGRSRTRDVTYARHLAMYLLREDAKLSVAEIGRMFGGRDHSTVLGGINRIALETTTRPETATDLAVVRDAIADARRARAEAKADQQVLPRRAAADRA